MDIHPFLQQVVSWAKVDPGLQAVALVGSYAHQAETEALDIDLVLIAAQPEAYLADTTWVQSFGDPLKQLVEDYGKLTSLRVWYSDGREVEFGLTGPGWMNLPLDAGTQRVIDDGMVILFERDQLISSRLSK